MTILNSGKRYLLWLVPSPLYPLDYGGLTYYVGTKLAPYCPNLTVADAYVAHAAKFVKPMIFAPTRVHPDPTIEENALGVSVTGAGRRASSGFDWYPAFVYADAAIGKYTGDRLYARLTRIICHEFCHLMGAGHTDDPDDVMYHTMVDRPFTFNDTVALLLRNFFK